MKYHFMVCYTLIKNKDFNIKAFENDWCIVTIPITDPNLIDNDTLKQLILIAVEEKIEGFNHASCKLRINSISQLKF